MNLSAGDRVLGSKAGKLWKKISLASRFSSINYPCCSEPCFLPVKSSSYPITNAKDTGKKPKVQPLSILTDHSFGFILNCDLKGVFPLDYKIKMLRQAHLALFVFKRNSNTSV